MTLYFKNPSNNHIQKTTHHGLWSLVFGGFYFGYHGVWIHFLAFLFLGPLVWFVYPFFARDIIQTAALSKGLVKITEIEAKEAGVDIDPEDNKAIIAGLIMVTVTLIIVLALIFVGFSKRYGSSESEYEAAIAAIAALEAEASAAAAAAEAAARGPDKETKESPEFTRFEQSYFQLPKPLVAKLAGSRKVMQATVAIMTHYDSRVVENVDKHDFPLRFAMLSVMRLVTEDDITSANFQTDLAEKLKIEMNAVLESLEDFGGIEAVYFTEFSVK